MITLDLHIDPTVLRIMHDLVDLTADSLKQQRAVESDAYVSDPELEIVLEEELLEALRRDLDQLLGLFRVESFGREELELTEAEGEAALRASAAVRLRLRESALRNLSDEALEGGEVELLDLPLEQQKGYACYLFLAGLQSLLMDELDPDSADLSDLSGL